MIAFPHIEGQRIKADTPTDMEGVIITYTKHRRMNDLEKKTMGDKEGNRMTEETKNNNQARSKYQTHQIE